MLGGGYPLQASPFFIPMPRLIEVIYLLLLSFVHAGASTALGKEDGLGLGVVLHSINYILAYAALQLLLAHIQRRGIISIGSRAVKVRQLIIGLLVLHLFRWLLPFADAITLEVNVLLYVFTIVSISINSIAETGTKWLTAAVLCLPAAIYALAGAGLQDAAEKWLNTDYFAI